MRSVFLLLSAGVATSFASSSPDSCNDADTQSLLQAKTVVHQHSAKDVVVHEVDESESDRNPNICEVGADVLCSDGETMCAGDQCCPDGSTCPSALSFHAEGCPAPKARECTDEGRDCASNRNTGGTCFFSDCYAWRDTSQTGNPEDSTVECRFGRCMCKRGHCSTHDAETGHDGVCFRQRDWLHIEGQAPPVLLQKKRQEPAQPGCDINDDVLCSDGVTMCSGNQCCPDQSTCPSAENIQADGCNVKADGHDCVEERAAHQAELDLQHQCSQSQDTGGTCAWFGCYGWRGDTRCEDSKCLCQEGSCAEDGVCYDAHAWIALQVDPDFTS